METQQFNLRVSKSIIFDLEFISRATGLDKSEWVRVKLAEAIRSEKELLLYQAEKDFTNCRIDVSAFKELTGYIPNKSLINARLATETRREDLNRAVQNNESRSFARKALLEGKDEKKRKTSS